MTRRLVAMVVFGLTAALVSGCASVEKQNAVRRIAHAVDTMGLRTGTITIATRPISGPASAVPSVSLPSIGGGSATPPAASLRVVVDRAGRRAALLAPPAAAARLGISQGESFPALVVFAGDSVYVRASDIGLIGARPWLSLNVTDLGSVNTPSTEELGRPRTFGDLAVVSPVQVLDLALGVLTGSVKRPTPTVYKANTSVEKEYRERHFDASDSDEFLQLLRSFAVKDDINPIDVELDAQRGLRAVAVEFVGKPEYGVKFGTRIALTLDAPGAAVDRSVLAVPSPADAVSVSSIGDLREAIDQWTLVEAKP